MLKTKLAYLTAIFSAYKDKYQLDKQYLKKINRYVRQRTEGFKLIADDTKCNGFVSLTVGVKKPLII